MRVFRERSDTHPTEVQSGALAQFIARYREPSHARSLFELSITAGALALLWTLMWFVAVRRLLAHLADRGAGGRLCRAPVHDPARCGHGAFSAARPPTTGSGRTLGILTLTPYDVWRRAHAMHHATTGNLDRRGMGDVETLTVREYLARSRLGRLAYRLYRHPVVLFGVGPAICSSCSIACRWG